ncbi:MAG: YkgJ family cysteine cluster protein [Acidimicrobiia bacterium]|nr:YkgJ family cysteine cluster protein [Acidimicrobiia bacterium]
MRVFALNFHANYRCRHAGACCTAGWPIPVEPARRRLLGADVLLPDAKGACRFYDRQDHRCRVHRDHGEAMLPSSCFHFPRRALLDERGVFVSLSHFCPTAARLLVEAGGPLRTVESPPAFPTDREYEGLDGRGAWAPLIKTDLLFDLEGFDAWERYALEELSDETVPAAHALRRLAAATEHLRNWRPDEGPLAERLRHLATRTWAPEELTTAWKRYERFSTLEAYASLRALVPHGLDAPQLAPEHRQRWEHASGASMADGVVRRYIAAKLFGSWAAYETFGLRTMVAELTLADLVLRVEAVRGSSPGHPPAHDDAMVRAVRAADWLLVHLVDRPALITWLGDVERDA